MTSGGPKAPPRAVLFDFDGVILESAGVKAEAFEQLFAGSEHLPRILRHHKENLGVSRFEKFAWIYRELLERPLTPEVSRDLGERYSRLALGRTLACPPVRGALETLEELSGRALCFIVSATPQDELELIVQRRRLARHFTEVRGSPERKAAICRDLLGRYRLLPTEAVMVGDGLSDYHAARSVGIPFVLRETEDQRELFEQLEMPRVPDLTRLPVLLGFAEARFRDERPANSDH